MTNAGSCSWYRLLVVAHVIFMAYFYFGWMTSNRQLQIAHWMLTIFPILASHAVMGRCFLTTATHYRKQECDGKPSKRVDLHKMLFPDPIPKVAPYAMVGVMVISTYRLFIAP